MTKNKSYWQDRKDNASGRPKKIKTPRVLWGHFCDYCERVESHPFLKQEQKKGNIIMPKGTAISDDQIKEIMSKQIVELETIRPFTWQGFEDYLFEKKVIVRLDDYKSNKDGRYSEFADIITRIGNVIFSNKFEGAAVGAFNANIIARDLGLVDKSSTEMKVEQPLFPDVSKNDSNK